MPKIQIIKEKKKPFYLEKFKILIILLILVILLPGYFFFIKPEYESYNKNKQINSQYQNQRELSLSQLKDYKKTLSVYNSVNRPEEEKINQILPDHYDEANLYINLESIVKSSGLNLDSITISPVLDVIEKRSIIGENTAAKSALSSQIGFININLVISDVSYIKVKNLFTILETNIRLLDVQNFNFTAADGTLSLSLRTYYLKK